MGRKEIEQKLTALGFSNAGPARDARYDKWVHTDGRSVLVPRVDILNDYTADRILTEAER